MKIKLYDFSFVNIIVCVLLTQTLPLNAIEQVNQWQAMPLTKIPSDPTAFTQGLLYDNGYFYQSTGLYGQSTVRKINEHTGEAIILSKLNNTYFGEGITKIGSYLYQLTWRGRKGIAYREDIDGLRRVKSHDFTYNHQGWGLTNDGKYLIVSDGTSTLRFLSIDNKSLAKTLNITFDNQPLNLINELQYVEGKIFANVLNSNNIFIINPKNGKVTDTITVDLGRFFTVDNNPLKKNSAAVLNGIAYDSRTKRVFITGKLWPTIFEISWE